MNSIIFTTAFKDIGRDKWKTYSRTNETYIKCFLQLANGIKYNLIVYVEDDILTMLKTYTFKSNIIFKSYNDVDTFYNQYIENEKMMINSPEYIAKCRPDRRIQNPEHWCAEYNMATNSKINFVSHTKKCFPDYKYYSWIDFGCIRDIPENIPNNINFDKLTESIMYSVFAIPPNIPISAEDILKSDFIFIKGAEFVVHTNLVEKFEQLYKDLLEKWKQEIICDDDQNAVLQIYFENRSLFHLVKDNEWVSLFRKYLNCKNIVIAGLCKNIGKYLEGSKKNIMKIANQFNDYKIVMIENDSTDNTREFLKKWSEEDSKVKTVFIDKLNEKIKARHRTEVIAYCRNLCQEIIGLYNKLEFPYTLMVDMDDCLQSEKFSYEGVLSSIQLLETNRKLAFVGAVIDGPYYDIYALRNEECNYNCWKMVFANMKTMGYEQAVDKFIRAHTKNYSKYENPVQINSAFGGAGVFRNKYWFESKYKGIENDGTEACEHVHMCLGLKEKGYQLVLNPKFILY